MVQNNIWEILFIDNIAQWLEREDSYLGFLPFISKATLIIGLSNHRTLHVMPRKL